MTDTTNNGVLFEVGMYQAIQAHRLILWNVHIVFGDNLLEKGQGGQAIVRTSPNAFGIPTKKAPGKGVMDYFSDDDAKVIPLIRDKFEVLATLLQAGDGVIYPRYGLGSGRAMLSVKAPRIYAEFQDGYQKLRATASKIILCDNLGQVADYLRKNQ